MLPNEYDIREAVVEFIIDRAQDDECLYEIIGDLHERDTWDWSEDQEQSDIALAYRMHRRAKITVEIDGREYES